MRILPICLVAIASLPLTAGERILSESTDVASNKVTQHEILLDATRMRMNMGNDSSVLFLTDGGRPRMVMLNKAKNEYHEMDQQTMAQMAQATNDAMAMLNNMPPEQKAMMERMMKGRGMMAAAPAPIVYTSKGSATVNGFSCMRYDGTRDTEKVAEVCAASASVLRVSPADYQVFDKMREFIAPMMKSIASSPFGSALSQSQFTDPGFQGFPVLHTTFSNGKPSHKTELKSVAAASFSDADFSLGNAKKIEMPMPAARGRRGAK